jgi:hypothetical protein
MRVNLLDHIMAILHERDRLNAERDRRIDAEFEAQKSAVTTAMTATERRFDSVNEFRQTLSDQAHAFATRDQLDALRAIVGLLAARLDKLEGQRSGLGTGWSILVAVVGVGLGVYGLTH